MSEVYSGVSHSTANLYVIKIQRCCRFLTLYTQLILGKPQATLGLIKLLPAGILLLIGAHFRQMLQNGPANTCMPSGTCT